MVNPARFSTEDQRRALKIAAKIVVNLLGGGREAARLTVVDPSMLSLYGAVHEADRHMRLDVALDLDLAAGEPHVARALAAAQGFHLVRDGEADGDAARLVTIADLARLQKEASEAKLSLISVLDQSDGRAPTGAMRASVLKELADLRQAIAAIEAKIGGAA